MYRVAGLHKNYYHIQPISNLNTDPFTILKKTLPLYARFLKLINVHHKRGREEQ